MPPKAKTTPAQATGNPLRREVESVLASLKRLGDRRIREEMSPRYGIVTNSAFGVRMSEMQQVAKRLGRNHALAIALWETGKREITKPAVTRRFAAIRQ